MPCTRLNHSETDSGANALKAVVATISFEEEGAAAEAEEKKNNKSKMAGSVCLLLTTRQRIIFVVCECP